MSEILQRLREEDWKVLIDRIKAKRCTPFIGAGARYEGFSLRSGIAAKWAEDEHYPWDDKYNLARVARYMSVSYDDEYTKNQLVTELAGIPAPNFDQDPYDPHLVLADLKLPIYITTNYDDFMFQALKKRELDAMQEWCRWKKTVGDPPSIFEDGFNPTPAQPVVFHFHGQTDNTDSLVLTEDDYFEFLINVSKDEKLIPPKIQKALTGASLLLLGYQLNDWDFRVLFHLLAGFLKINLGRKHVCVQVAPVVNEPNPAQNVWAEEERLDDVVRSGDDLAKARADVAMSSDDVAKAKAREEAAKAREKAAKARAEQIERAENFLRTYFGRYRGLDIRVYFGSCQEFAMELKDRWEKAQ